MDWYYKDYDENWNLIYEGEFKDWKYHGYWKYYNSNYLLFEWEFKEGERLKGKYYNDPTDPFGLVYDGEFNEQWEKHWKWKYIALGIVYYDWEFQHNNIYWKWKLYDNGVLAYDGDFVEARREWHGKYYINGVLVYEWEWKDWKPLQPREWYDEEKENYRYNEWDLSWRFWGYMTALQEHRKGTL